MKGKRPIDPPFSGSLKNVKFKSISVPYPAGASPEFRGIRAPRTPTREPPPLERRPLPRLRRRQGVQVRDGHLAVPFQRRFRLQLHPVRMEKSQKFSKIAEYQRQKINKMSRL